MPIELKMPALSPTMREGILAKWLVDVGSSVRSGAASPVPKGKPAIAPAVSLKKKAGRPDDGAHDDIEGPHRDGHAARQFRPAAAVQCSGMIAGLLNAGVSCLMRKHKITVVEGAGTLVEAGKVLHV